MAANSESAAPNGGCANGAKDGPVLSLMSKRLRALKKKYNRILQIEESKAQGKAINKEQEDVLKSKASVSVMIEEYERLRPLLSTAVKEELEAFEKEKESKEKVENDDKDDSQAESATAVPVEAEIQAEADTPAEKMISEDDIAELVKVLYFANLFDVSKQNDFASLMWTRVHERSSCLSYDYVTDDATKPLREEDLDVLATFGSMITSRAPNATLSHKTALYNCVHHAKHWLLNSDIKIHPEHSVSYTDIRERLNRILSSEYFTMTPELQTVTQETAVAAATAAGQYVTQVLVHENAVDGLPLQNEAPTIYYSLADQATRDAQMYQTDEQMAPSGNATDHLEAVKEPNSPTENVSESNVPFEVQNDAEQSQLDLDPVMDQKSPEDGFNPQSHLEEHHAHHSNQQADLDPEVHYRDYGRRDQQHYVQNGGSQRVYPNHQRGGRGMGYGGRGRGYSNGRGRSRGSSYGGGRGHYYDQGNSYYYPRNYSSGRGRGRRSNDAFYNNNTAESQRSVVTATT